MGRTRTRLAVMLVLALALALVALTPMLAHAAPPRASIVTSDSFEPDDTTATAKPFSTLTLHTFTGPMDMDWSYVDVTATGTPIMAETDWRSAFGFAVPVIQVLNPDGTTTSMGMPAAPFGGVPFPSAFMLRAPVAPARYFVSALPAFGLSDGGGSYQLFEGKKQIRRISGPSRFATAVEVSKKMWRTTDSSIGEILGAQGGGSLLLPRGCIVATGRNFADALAAGAWISKDGPQEDHMPILLTERDSLNPLTAAEIARLASGRRATNLPFTVYVIGGPSAVSDGVKRQIERLGANDWSRLVSKVERLGGANRFETAVLIAAQEASTGPGIGNTVFITNAFSYADALSAGPVAGRASAPILGVTRTAVPPATAAFLAAHPGIKYAVVVGGGSVVDTAVANVLAAAPYSLDVTRVAGPNRYATSRELADFGVRCFGMSAWSEIIVTGADYPDGLAAAGLTGFTRGPVLLTPGGALSSEVATFFGKFPTMSPSYLIGGPAAVSNGVEAQFDALRPTLLPPD